MILKILEEIQAERARQDAKWGVQDHPSVSCVEAAEPADYPSYYDLPVETVAKENCENAFKHGEGSYAHIAVEEMCEAVGAANEDERRKELIQLAAVCVAWIEAIDRRKKAERDRGDMNVASFGVRPRCLDEDDE